MLAGEVVRLRAAVLPHMGWNTVRPPAGSTLFAGVAEERFYFVHSYAAPGRGEGESLTVHGEPFVAAVESGVTQRDPVPSGEVRPRGSGLLRNWVSTL